jgi:hypothetical protein
MFVIMAKEKNSTLTENEETPAEITPAQIWKQLEQASRQAFDDEHVGSDRREIKFISEGKSDDGALRFLCEIPYESIGALKSLVAGERKFKTFSPALEVDLSERARKGEFEPLIRYFENGGEVTEKQRHTLAKIARGMLPRIGRPPETETETRNRDIVRFAQTLKLLKGRRVYDVTARKFDIDRSYGPKLIKKYRGEGWGPYLMGCMLISLGADQKTARRVMMELAGIDEDDLREATGRKQKVRK